MKKKSLIVSLYLILFIFTYTSFALESTVNLKKGAEKEGLDNNKTGIVLLPSAYNRDISKGGLKGNLKTILRQSLNFDFLLSNYVGEIYGKRNDNNSTEWTNPLLMSLVTVNSKFILLREQKRSPSVALGVLGTFALDIGGGSFDEKEQYEFKELDRPSSAFAFSLTAGKNIWRKKNWLMNLGYISSGYAKIFSNIAPYYYPHSAHIAYLGFDLNFIKKNGLYLEIIKPMGDEQNPFLINIRIKKFIPTVAFTFVNTDAGYSFSTLINFRISLFPPYTREELVQEYEKKQLIEKRKEWDKKLNKIKFD